MNSLSIGMCLLERFQLQSLLQERRGQSTWKAIDLQSDQPVIVKMLELSHIPDWDALKLFEREVQVLESLSHPQIPRLLCHFRSDDQQQLFLVMQYIAGQSLKQRLQTGPLSESEAMQLARQVLNILEHLHHFSPPVIHRDIKPGNLMLGPEQKVYLIDFGAVKDLSSTQHTVVGTFGYLAPEQLAGQTQPVSDLYALGVTLVEALSGTPAEALPRDGLRIQLHRLPKLSAPLTEWLEELLAPEISLRFASAKQALQALEMLVPTGPPPVIQLPPKSRVSLDYPSPDQLVISIGRSRKLWDAFKFLTFPAFFSLFITLNLMFVLTETSLFSRRSQPWEALLAGQLTPEWLMLLPLSALFFVGFSYQFYRLWYRPFELVLEGSQLRCVRNQRTRWEINTQELSQVQIMSHFFRAIHQSNPLKTRSINVRLYPAEWQVLKTALREQLRRELPRAQYQKLLKGLKT